MSESSLRSAEVEKIFLIPICLSSLCISYLWFSLNLGKKTSIFLWHKDRTNTGEMAGGCWQGHSVFSSSLQECCLCLTVCGSCDPFVVVYLRENTCMKHHCTNPSELVSLLTAANPFYQRMLDSVPISLCLQYDPNQLSSCFLTPAGCWEMLMFPAQHSAP